MPDRERQLCWKAGFSLTRKPEKKSVHRRKRRHQFEFVVENPVKDYQPRHSPTPPGSLGDSSVVAAEDGAVCKAVSAIVEDEPLIDSSLSVSADGSAVANEGSPELETIDGTALSPVYLRNSEDQHLSSSSPESTTNEHFDNSVICLGTCHDGSSEFATAEPNPAAVSALIQGPYFSVPKTIQYSNLSQRFKPILDRYNKEFCLIPLTFDIRINPFRYRTNLNPEPTFLVHAVMALAGHHVDSTSTLDHRHAALELLRQNLNTYRNAEDICSMIDAIIILFSLDETQSALGNWTTHLVGAYGLLEAGGGIEALSMSARVRAQIGMLTWWDAITSLLSRESCVFPYAYFEAVLSNQNRQEWDFFGLCGCPTSLVKIVMRVARLSEEWQESSSAQHSPFDITMISDLENSLDSWLHIPAATAFVDEESMQRDQDVMHCSEAWRNGILLYIFRVFRWKPGNSIPMRILYCARALVDHVMSCRDAAMISRQALLPLFFAGCELKDVSTRAKILKFCSVWSERTKYHMFGTTIPLLEEIWAEQEAKGFENVWWGQVVDRYHSSKFDHPLQMRLCFG